MPDYFLPHRAHPRPMTFDQVSNTLWAKLRGKLRLQDTIDPLLFNRGDRVKRERVGFSGMRFHIGCHSGNAAVNDDYVVICLDLLAHGVLVRVSAEGGAVTGIQA